MEIIAGSVVKVDDQELDIVAAVVRNLNHWLFFLDPCQREFFFEWLKSHTGSDVVENGKLNRRLSIWLNSLPKQRALDEGFLIASEIFWFMNRGAFDEND